MRELDELLLPGAGTWSATSAATHPPFNFETLQAAYRLLEQAPSEPFGEWMREKGCPPEAWDLVLPERLKSPEFGLLPRYVLFSRYVNGPTFVRRGFF